MGCMKVFGFVLVPLERNDVFSSIARPLTSYKSVVAIVFTWPRSMLSSQYSPLIFRLPESVPITEDLHNPDCLFLTLSVYKLLFNGIRSSVELHYVVNTPKSSYAYAQTTSLTR
jgi:hypothetical protein